MSEHTPEPWYVHAVFVASKRAPKTWRLTRDEFKANPDPIGEVPNLADAQRAVACVNACAGIDDPADTLAKVRALLGQLSDARGKPDDLQAIMSQGYANHAIARLGLGGAT